MPRKSRIRRTANTSPELVPPVGPSSQAIEVAGFIHFSVGEEATTGALVAGGIAAETERVFRNLSAVSKAAGRRFDDVVRAGVHPANMNDFRRNEWHLRNAFQSSLSRPHDDRGGRALGPALRSTSSPRLEARAGIQRAKIK